jgi:hypothetical protein
MLAGKDWKDFQSCFRLMLRASSINEIVASAKKMQQNIFWMMGPGRGKNITFYDRSHYVHFYAINSTRAAPEN